MAGRSHFCHDNVTIQASIQGEVTFSPNKAVLFTVIQPMPSTPRSYYPKIYEFKNLL